MYTNCSQSRPQPARMRQVPLGRTEQHVRDLAPAQWPVGGIIDADFDGFLAFFAARFSLRVLACFFRSSLWADLLAMEALLVVSGHARSE